MAEFPYPGLRPFDRDDADVFFGRETHVNAMIDRLAEQRLLTVTGTSGSGKSSLVRAGLLEALEMGLLAKAGRAWRFAILRPGLHPLSELARTLLRALDWDEEASKGPLDRGPLSIIDELRDCPLTDGSNILILIDQFEELFRYQNIAGYEEAETFVAVLLAARRQRDVPIYVVLTLRSDFLGNCARFDGLAEAVSEALYLCPRLWRDQIVAAIKGPANVFGGDVEPDLVDRLIEDMGADPDQLPLMQHALSRLWDVATKRDPSKPVLRLQDYLDADGLKGSLSNHADQIFATVSGNDFRCMEIVRRLFCLLTEGETAERAVRRPVSLEDVVEVTAAGRDEITDFVDPFRKPSFVLPALSTPLSDDTVLDICHESLIRQWSKMGEWVRGEANSAEQYLELERRALRWENAKAEGAKKTLLWTGADLEVALAWRDRERPTSAWARRYGTNFGLTMRFLDASVAQCAAQEEARRAQEQRIREIEQRARTAEERLARGGSDVQRAVPVSGARAMSVFMSFSQRDRELAQEVYLALKEVGFEYVFFDFDKNIGISAGENWERRLYEELSRCSVVIVILTPSWVESKWCFVEFSQARALGKMIVPIRSAPVADLFALTEIQDIDVIDWNIDGRERLAHQLTSMAHEAARGFELDPNRPPYPGLCSFESEDAAVFFGRDAESQAIIERLLARRTQGGARMLTIVGASGVGKSSLLKAGILSQLGRHQRDWVLLPAMRPGRRPLEALARALANAYGDPHAWRSLYMRLGNVAPQPEFAELVRDLCSGAAPGATVLLLIDQLEELFTASQEGERSAFMRAMAELLDPARDLPVLAVTTLRADMLWAVLAESTLAQLVEVVPLLPIPIDRVPQLVEGPAGVAGLSVEKGLAERMARDMGSPDSLPLFAYALRMLYDRCAHDRRLTVASYDLLGAHTPGLSPIQSAMRIAADSAIEAVRPSAFELAALREAFVPHLVRLTLDEGRPVRRRARLASLPPLALPLIDALSAANVLIRAAGDQEPDVEVAHEALFTAWPMLAGWLNEEHAFLADIERIKAAHDVWSQAPETQKLGALLHGLALANAREWLAKHPQRFVGQDMGELRDFIVASGTVEQRRRRRIVAIAAAAVTALVCSTAIASVGYFMTQEAERAAALESARAAMERNRAVLYQSRFLAGLARQAHERGDDRTAVSLAMQAYTGETQNIPDANTSAIKSILATSLPGSGRRVPLAKTAFFSNDGARVFSIRGDVGELSDAATGKIIAVLRGHSDAISAGAFSLDGAWLATASFDRTTRIWQVATGREIAVLRGEVGVVTAISFSPDSRQLVTGSQNGTVQLWSVESAALIATLSEHTAAINSAAYSPGGDQVITASDDRTVRIWDTGAKKKIQQLDHSASVLVAQFSLDERNALTATEAVQAFIWTLPSGKGPVPFVATGAGTAN